MANLKPTSEIIGNPKDRNGRRSFIWKAGTAMTAVVASAVAGVSRTRSSPDMGLKGEIDRLSNLIGNLEDANVLRELHRAYESCLDRGRYEEAVDMFTDDGEVVFNGGIFSGKDKGISRLYCGRFSSGLTGRRIEPAPGYEPDPGQQTETLEVAPDRRSATGQFAYSIQVGTPMTGESSLVEMARLQGEGIIKWWECGTCRVSYVKVNGTWKIKRLEYRTTSRADYRPGRLHARPVEIAAFSKIYPADPAGPDKLA